MIRTYSTDTLDTSFIVNATIINSDKKSVNIKTNNADYYKVSINITGWYNIDILLEERNNVMDSKLLVQVNGNMKNRIELFLVIPSFKVFVQGGYLEDDKTMGFKYADGSLPLPQHVKALVFAIYEEKGRFYYARKWFTTKQHQLITLQTKQYDETGFRKQLTSLAVPELEMDVLKSLNSDSLKAIDRTLDSLAKSGAEQCNCLGQ